MSNAGKIPGSADEAVLPERLPDGAALTLPEKPRRSLMRAFIAALMLLIGVAILAFVANGEKKANTDFVSYWSAGQQIIHHHNPYDGKSVLALERSVGYTATRPEIMRNMPYALFLAYPLGFLSERTGSIVWSLFCVAVLMFSIHLIWVMHGRREDGLKLLGYCFPPVLACLITGQVGALLLLGVTLFLLFHRDRPIIAGGGLFLCLLKPHVFVPFGVVFLLWSFTRRRYRVLISSVVFFVAGTALGLWMDPHGWTHYSAMMESQHLADAFVPTASLFFRLLVARHLFWVQFIPVIAGSCWAIWYFMHNRAKWNWRKHGLVLLLVSMFVAPYSWFTDQTVVLPAIMAGLYFVSDAKRSMLPFWCIAGVALMEVFAGVPLTSGFYAWTSAAWLLWYLYSQKTSNIPVSELTTS